MHKESQKMFAVGDTGVGQLKHAGRTHQKVLAAVFDS